VRNLRIGNRVIMFGGEFFDSGQQWIARRAESLEIFGLGTLKDGV
jgi:hypothetical protein